LDAALAVMLERERRFHQRRRAAAIARGAELLGQRLAVIAGERGFRIEGIDVRRAAVHEQENDALGERREVRGPRRQWIRGGGRRGRTEKSRVSKHAGTSQRAEATADSS